MNHLSQIPEIGHSSLETAVRENTEFALALYQKLQTVEGNLFISPYSISIGLAMAYAGAHGDTEIQMAQALHFILSQEQLHPAFSMLEAKLGEIGKKGHIQLRVANTLWPQKGFTFLEEFLALVKQYYGVRVTALDYGNAEAARRTINSWVEDKTERKIMDLIPPGVLDALTRMVLVNAIYFKGNWASQFEQRLTHQAPFGVKYLERVQIPMMYQENSFRYAEVKGLQILELPYAGEDLSMLVLLPRENDGLPGLEQSLTIKNLGTWNWNLQMTKVEVYLPRFEIAFPFSLDSTLQSMGMVDAFSMEHADFSGMDGSKKLYIGAVLHKAFVSVNEEGAEAAAATGFIVELGIPDTSIPVFRADHPFIFLIRENSTRSILFLGRVVNPTNKIA